MAILFFSKGRFQVDPSLVKRKSSQEWGASATGCFIRASHATTGAMDPTNSEIARIAQGW